MTGKKTLSSEFRGISTAIACLRPFSGYWRPFRAHFALYIVCTMGTSVPVLVLPLIIRRILNVAYPERDYRLLWTLIGTQIAIAAIGGLLAIIATYMGTYITNKVEFSLCHKFYRILNNLDLPSIERRQKGEFIERLLSDIGTLASRVTNIWGGIADTVFTLAVALYFMFRISFLATALILLSAPLAYLFTVIAQHKLRRLALAGRRISEQLNTFIGETVEGADIVRIYGFHKRLTRRLSELLRSRVSLAFQIWRTGTKWRSLAQGTLKGWGIAIGIGAWILLFRNRLELGDVAALGLYMVNILRPVQGISGIYQELIRLSVPAHRLLDMKYNENLSDEKNGPPPVKLREPPVMVDFRNVGFAYKAGIPVLSDLSLKLSAGERVAVVGANGSGKSTLLRILAGLDRRYTGHVRINGIEMKELDIKSYWHHVSFVPQRTFFFNDSILGNIAPDGDKSQERVLRLAAEMGVEEAILGRSGGLKCTINDGQLRLSGGQEKHAAILRAALKLSNLMLLDEPFANVDMQTGKSISCSLPSMIPDDAIVVVAIHGDKWIADGWIERVILMDKGQLVDDLTVTSFFRKYPTLLKEPEPAECSEKLFHA